MVQFEGILGHPPSRGKHLTHGVKKDVKDVLLNNIV